MIARQPMQQPIRTLALLAGLCAAALARADATDAHSTQWHVQTAAGLDAVVFIGALTGNSLQYQHYQQEVDHIRPRLNANAKAALERLTEFAELHGMLLGPNLALIFSAGPVESLDKVIASAREPEARLRPGLETSEYWDPREWTWVRDETLPDVLAVLTGLREAGFETYWEEIAAPTLEMRVEATRKYLQRFDIIPEHERLLGRPLDPEIDVFLLYFSKPYGIRVSGQRFASHYSYPMYIQLRTATHEMFHPPFERGDHSVYERLEALRTDDWMQSILRSSPTGWASTRGRARAGATPTAACTCLPPRSTRCFAKTVSAKRAVISPSGSIRPSIAACSRPRRSNVEPP